jgi:hypothetical protein
VISLIEDHNNWDVVDSNKVTLSEGVLWRSNLSRSEWPELVPRKKGVDYFDGTPILDIKRYRRVYRIDNFTLPDWHRKLEDK